MQLHRQTLTASQVEHVSSHMFPCSCDTASCVILP